MTTKPASPIRLILGGLLASIFSGVLGGVVLAVMWFLGSIVLEVASGEALAAELQDGFFEATLMFGFGGAAFGLMFGAPFAAVLGHAVIFFTRNNPSRQTGLAMVIGAVATALIVSLVYPLTATEADTMAEGWGGLVRLMFIASIAGAIAGSFAAWIFFAVRGWIVPNPKPSIAQPPVSELSQQADPS